MSETTRSSTAFGEVVRWAMQHGFACVSLGYLNDLTRRAVDAEMFLGQAEAKLKDTERERDDWKGIADSWKKELDQQAASAKLFREIDAVAMKAVKAELDEYQLGKVPELSLRLEIAQRDIKRLTEELQRLNEASEKWLATRDRLFAENERLEAALAGQTQRG